MNPLLFSLNGMSMIFAVMFLSSSSDPSAAPTRSDRPRPAVGNREPLAPSPFIKLPIGDIEPRGWLRTQLELQRDGFIGHLDELSRFVTPQSGWMKPENPGWEELPYWLKGFGDTAYVLKDAAMTARAKTWIDAALSSQQPDGYFGPLENKKGRDWWPHMVMLYAFRSYHEATGDPRIIPAMLGFFRFLSSRPEGDLIPYRWGDGPYRKEWWQSVRSGDLLQSIYWTYNRTGEAWLLDLAKRVHERSADWVNGIPTWHGVNLCQGFREPAVYYQQAKDATLLKATYRNYTTVMEEYGQVPGGMFGADENCRKGFTGPRQAAETCSMVEFMNSFQELIRIDGLSVWADRCEDVAFNSLPASMTPDLKGLRYLTAPNMPQADHGNKAPGIENGGEMISFNPWTYRCCQHNAGQGWPYFAEHLWMATPDGGLAAVMYAPCEVRALVAGDVEVHIIEQTAYPFDENVVLRLKLSGPATFPLRLRRPGWCRNPVIRINGRPVATAATVKDGFIVLEGPWKDGDEVRLELPMDVAVTRWDRHGGAVSVRRGPLWYSLKIEEDWRRYGGSDAWPAQDVFPKSAWNYGLLPDAGSPASSITVVRRMQTPANQPFTPAGTPVVLEARASRIPQWQLDRRGLVMELQQSPAKVEPGEPETITLIPMGCARLRISAFPTVTTGPDGHIWQAPPPARHEASFECPFDDIAALSDGKIPKNSNDHDIPRFTWWDHKGTTEWATYLFDAKRRVTSARVYWFDDEPIGGGCRTPKSWRLEYCKGQEWLPVELVPGAAYTVDKDVFNEVTFKDVESTALRIVVELRPGYSAGILEWEISGDKIPAPK